MVLSWAHLTATERRLCEFAADGQLLDLSTGGDDEDDPTPGITGAPSAKCVPNCSTNC